MGIVIGETATVGDGCLLYKGVVLGGTSLERKVRHPQIGNDVVIGSNACILGDIHIGDHARIGSGSVVVQARCRRRRPSWACRRASSSRVTRASTRRSTTPTCPIPSPTWSGRSPSQNEMLRERVSALEKKLGVEHDEPPFHLPYDGEELPRADGG